MKAGKVILREPTLAAEIDEIVKGLADDADRVHGKTGEFPDRVEVFDHLKNEGAAYAVAKSDADRT